MAKHDDPQSQQARLPPSACVPTDPLPPPSGRLVRFIPEPSIIPIETRKTSELTMAHQLYETFTGEQIKDSMLVDAARLFSDNYGVWGSTSTKPGERVKLNARRLRAEYLPEGAETVYTRVTVDGVLAGNALVCRWKHDGRNICWVTQLVVHQEYRERGLAGGLLRSLRAGDDDIYGIMSSHPAACLAAAKCFGTSIEKVSLSFIRENAEAVMHASPIPYVRETRLSGSVFNAGERNGLISGVNTGFFVDHAEPLEALALIRQDWHWPLGELPEGHEFLLLLPDKRRRSRSLSSSRSATVQAE